MGTLDDKVIRDIQALIAGLPSHSGSNEGARFWETLSAKHVALLQQHGFENFKRTINFEYSQWGVTSFRDNRIRRLFWGLLRQGRIPAGALARYDLLDRAVRWPDGIDLGTGEAVVTTGTESTLRFRAHAVYCGLLWQLAQADDSLGVLGQVREPSLGNPLPITWRGRLISQDLAMGSLELNRIHRHFPLGRVRRVLEIGAGYGRLAWLFRMLYPEIEYSIVDIPPALALSKRYLQEEFGSGSVATEFWGRSDSSSSAPSNAPFRLYTPDALPRLPDGRFDLILNISSFDEMDPATVAGYLKAIDRLGCGAVYLKGYGRTRSPRRWGLESFPRGPGWNVEYLGDDPVIPGFVETVWRKS